MRHQDMNVRQIELGTIVLEVAQIAGDARLRLPPELTMLGKTLLNLDQVGRTLDPEFDPNASIRRNAVRITRQRARRAHPGLYLQGLIEIKDLAGASPRESEQNPGQNGKQRDRVERNAIDEKSLMTGFQ